MDTTQSIVRVLFDVIKKNPGLMMYEIHAIMKTDPRYKPASVDSFIYKMLKDKQLARDKRRAFFAAVDGYTPLPKAPTKAKRKAVEAKKVSKYTAAREQWDPQHAAQQAALHTQNEAMKNAWIPATPMVKPAVETPSTVVERGFVRRLVDKPVSAPFVFAMSVGSFLAARYLT